MMTSSKSSTIETTLGDLISAICDAAEEAQVNECEIAKVAQKIIENLFSEADSLR